MNRIVLGVSLVTALMASSLAFSQEETEVGKLKQRLMALEQKIYSGNSSSSDNGMMADFEARLGGLEEEAQKVYGAVEELGYTVDEFAKKMDLISKDFDLRLTDIEASIETMKKNPVAKVAPKKAPAKTKKKATPKKAAKKKQTSSAAGIPTKISAEDLYNKAYHLLVATSYAESEKWMKEFLKRHPEDNLADNANYWLGEIYLVQGDAEKAVVAFSTGLSKFPKGAKAPANLLKMGMAFKQIGKVDFAKSSWNKLLKDFKDSDEAKKATKELKALEKTKTEG